MTLGYNLQPIYNLYFNIKGYSGEKGQFMLKYKNTSNALFAIGNGNFRAGGEIFFQKGDVTVT